MTELSNFIVVGTPAGSEAGKWKSDPFSTGGRKTRSSGDGTELDNAYVTLALSSPEGGVDVRLRIIINAHPLPQLALIPKESQHVWVDAFPASFLNDGGGNVLELHSVGEVNFGVFQAICHFRQDS
jgi:hypothetical protein